MMIVMVLPKKVFQRNIKTRHTNTTMVVAIISKKADPRKVTMKKDGTDRSVTTIILRHDQPDIWSGNEEVL